MANTIAYRIGRLGGQLLRVMLDGFFIALGMIAAFSLVGCSEAKASPPRAAEIHHATLVRASHALWGLDAPIAVFAGQIHAESRWRADAKSPVGAEGLAQFMPATSAWLPEVAPQTGKPLPYNPGWALRALVAYNLWIHKQIKADNEYERMAMTLSAYNGGLGWVYRDKRLATRTGLSSLRWFGHVETMNAGRSAANYRENRHYPRNILQNYQHIYAKAGWGKPLLARLE